MLIGICGGSATGKSTLAAAMVNKLAGCLISSDSYFKPAQQIIGFTRYRYDAPNAIDAGALQRDVFSLLRGQAIKIPDYSMVLSKVTGHQIITPSSTIVLEGLHWIANAQIRNACDVIVLAKAEPDVMLLRRVARDSQFRGRNITQTVNSFNNHVLPAYQRYWQPLQGYADICIYNNVGDDLSLLVQIVIDKLKVLDRIENLRVA